MAEEAIKSKRDEPKRAQRAPSNVFAMFRQSQVQEFKEVEYAIFDPNNYHTY
uniref:Uncharacterized protein n=1 Tax=Arion vulgaris TaxID=1028688 RepID=A0A0B6ZGF8_9EUPU